MEIHARSLHVLLHGTSNTLKEEKLLSKSMGLRFFSNHSGIKSKAINKACSVKLQSDAYG